MIVVTAIVGVFVAAIVIWIAVRVITLPPLLHHSSVPEDDRKLNYYDGYFILCQVWDYLYRHSVCVNGMFIGSDSDEIISQALRDVGDAMKAWEQGRSLEIAPK